MPLPSSEEAWVVEHRVRHESPIRLLPALHMHSRHLDDVLNLSRANSRRRTHRRIVGRTAARRPGLIRADQRRFPVGLRCQVGMLTNLLTNRSDLHRTYEYTRGRWPRSVRASRTAGPWLTRKRSLVRT